MEKQHCCVAFVRTIRVYDNNEDLFYEEEWTTDVNLVHMPCIGMVIMLRRGDRFRVDRIEQHESGELWLYENVDMRRDSTPFEDVDVLLVYPLRLKYSELGWTLLS